MDFSGLDSIERMDVQDLLQTTLSTNNNTTTSGHWTTLNCRLSTIRNGCSAVAVHDRYIVVMGGHNMDEHDGSFVSSVDMIDTATRNNNHTVISGPSMTIARGYFASAVVGHCIYVVGGPDMLSDELTSVEVSEFQDPLETTETAVAVGQVFPSSCAWTTHMDLKLSDPQMDQHAVVALGSCLLVTSANAQASVQVMDTSRKQHVWNLPLFQQERFGCTEVAFSNGIAMISGLQVDSCETLSLMDKNTWCFRRLLEMVSNGRGIECKHMYIK